MAQKDVLPARNSGLEPLLYNHPGLVVDLGVGLWAWPIPVRTSPDALPELYVSCPDKPSNGVYLFKNAGGSDLLRMTAATRISGTVHYVMPSYIAGVLRVLAPGIEFPRFAAVGTAEKRPLPVAANFYKPAGPAKKGPRLRHNQWRYVDYDGDGVLDLAVAVEDWSYYGWDDAWDSAGRWTNGPLHGFVHVFPGQGDGGYGAPFLIQAGGQALDTFGCPSPNFVDFDGDGDLDLLCGEFLDGFTYFENVGSRTAPRYTEGRRLNDVHGDPLRMDLEMIVPVAFDWDGDGRVDLVVGDEDGRVAWIRNTGTLDSARRPVFERPVYLRQEAHALKCGALVTPVGFDWDGDGDVDLVCGNTAGYIEWFENLSGPGVEYPQWAAPRRVEVDGKTFRVMAGPSGSIQGPAEAKWGYTTLSVADWDLDGLPDIVLNSILGEVVWLRNCGTRAVPRFAAPVAVEVEWVGEQPALAWGWRKPQGRALLTQWRTTPVVFDFNHDGLPDLAVLDQEGYLAFFERARAQGRLILKSPRRAFVDEKGVPLRLSRGNAGASGRRKLCVADWDGDGRFDFLLNSANADFLRQVREENGMWFFQNAGPVDRRNIEGHDVSPAIVDFNGDGVPDFVGGAEDGRLYYLRNPRSR